MEWKDSGRIAPRWLMLLVGAVFAIAGTIGIAFAQAADAVCAEVKIVIEQKLSLERQAFDARMVITNGLADQKLENVSITLQFRSEWKDSGRIAPRWLMLLVGAVFAIAGTIGIAFAQAADAVCAEVKIVIEQKLSLERQAFDARMVITNGLADQKLENVSITLQF